MKQKDISTGVVYALKGKDTTPIPMVVVSTTHRFDRISAPPMACPNGKLRIDRFELTDGPLFMCIGITGADKASGHDLLLAAAAECKLPELKHVYNDSTDISVQLMKTPNRRFFITFLPAKEFAGEYAPVAKTVTAEQEAARAIRQARDDERNRIYDLIERMSELTGLPNLAHVNTDNTEVRMSVRSMEALLGRMEAMRSAAPLIDGAL